MTHSPEKRTTMTASNTHALATAIALPVLRVVLLVARDPTARLVAQESDVVDAWRDAYGPLKKAFRVTFESWKRNGGANAPATA
jgi:hypothetical protein